jgi:hypothetical protein
MSRPRIHQDVSQTADQKSEQKKFENKSQSYYAAVKKNVVLLLIVTSQKKIVIYLFWSKNEGRFCIKFLKIHILS